MSDIRVMADKAAFKILVRHLEVTSGHNLPIDRHELTNIIAEALKEYFGVQ